jgi:hypothetical protein
MSALRRQGGAPAFRIDHLVCITSKRNMRAVQALDFSRQARSMVHKSYSQWRQGESAEFLAEAQQNRDKEFDLVSIELAGHAQVMERQRHGFAGAIFDLHSFILNCAVSGDAA